MQRNSIKPLVSTEWLAENKADPSLRIVDVRWKFKTENGKGIAYDDRDGYLNGHIPGAVFAELARELSDPDHPVPDMMVSAEKFGSVMSRLGIGNENHVVVYDDSGLPLAAARLWWAFSRFGHDRVQVLDGGLQQWKKEGRPVTSEITSPALASFKANSDSAWIAEKADVAEAINDGETIIVDCLPNDLYKGSGDHTWGDRTGHIPGAINVPAIANIDPDLELVSIEERAKRLKQRGSFTFGSVNELAEYYRSKGIEPGSKVITYCGRGIAASCGLLALKYMGYDDTRLYDGSWAEWSTDVSLPIEKS